MVATAKIRRDGERALPPLELRCAGNPSSTVAPIKNERLERLRDDSKVTPSRFLVVDIRFEAVTFLLALANWPRNFPGREVVRLDGRVPRGHCTSY